MSSCITHPNFLVYVKPLMSPVGDCRVCFSLGWGSQKREHDRTVLLKCGTSTICLGDYCGNFKLSNFPNLKVERSENLQQTLDLYSMVEPTIACKMCLESISLWPIKPVSGSTLATETTNQRLHASETSTYRVLEPSLLEPIGLCEGSNTRASEVKKSALSTITVWG